MTGIPQDASVVNAALNAISQHARSENIQTFEVTQSAAEAIAASYTYDTWGTTTSSFTGVAAQNPWRYASGYTDATGLIKFGTRYYNPTWGRFTQQDPTGQESNAYNYANCNPVNATDPSGRSASGCARAIIGEVVAGVTVTAGLAAAIVGVVAEIPSIGVNTVIVALGVVGIIGGGYAVVDGITSILESC